MKHLTKIACGLAAAALTFTLAACDDSSSPNNANGPDNEEISSESNSTESSAMAESSETPNSSDTAKNPNSVESSGTSSDSTEPLDDNSSSSMAITCQALTLECYSATQLCNKGLTEYCVNSSSSGKEKCKNVSNIDGGSCQDYDTVIDCETGAYAVCLNNTWELAIIGASCPTTGKEMTVNEINLICNEGYWKYKSTIDKCPPGSSCQPPNYGCLTHPINGFSCNEGENKVYQLTVTTRGAGDCMYQCSSGKYHVVMPPVPTGN